MNDELSANKIIEQAKEIKALSDKYSSKMVKLIEIADAEADNANSKDGGDAHAVLAMHLDGLVARFAKANAPMKTFSDNFVEQPERLKYMDARELANLSDTLTVVHEEIQGISVIADMLENDFLVFTEDNQKPSA
ncbi:hypothetical protein [Sulfitobacter sp. R18_1]|uniref:hypothetical protein n=1 Tax=Sulfitobacter sp. R18_1 TaxID=2821104 RepID=UPI001ADC6128|nr:hypothetical protein [Sulfitobacter sp. R18_1]MBO9428123.1 hypothetical protein [Sulfitobacter sp. R18_1]